MPTVYLLEWIGSRELRQQVNANTNKIESYNGFAKWLSFGGDVIAENEPEEQQKRQRYYDLIASAVTRTIGRIADELAAHHSEKPDNKISIYPSSATF